MEQESRSKAAKAERLLAEADARTKEAKEQVRCNLRLDSPHAVTQSHVQHLPSEYCCILRRI